MGPPDAVASDVARLHEKYLMLASQAASQEKRNAHPRSV
jgi:dephospho-CoA kinase